MESIEVRYQAELKQTEVDHHTPTAGAMTNHIIANLWFFDLKLHQTIWYLKGEQSLLLDQYYRQLVETTRGQIDQLGALLRDEDEVVATTVAELTQYAMLDEDPRLKYATWEVMVDGTVHDFVTMNLFVDRAIKLAQREDKLSLAIYLGQLRQENKRHIRQIQATLGRNVNDGLIEEDFD